jgi:lipoprotein-anchoring transpeptidase ErfK/SrfK
MRTSGGVRRFRRLHLVAAVALVATGLAVAAPGPRTDATAYPGCTISTPHALGALGESVRCIELALRAATFQWGFIDTYYGSVTVTAVRNFQRANGLPVTGVVDARTATALGIWARPTTTTSPATSTDPTTSAPATTAPATTAPPTTAPPTTAPPTTAPSSSLPGCHPTGRSAVVDKTAQRFWLCRDGAAITGRLPMTSGSVAYGLPPIGTHRVTFKAANWSGGGFALSRFVAFYRSPRGNNIAFHETVRTQPESTIGSLSWRGESAGCLRLRRADSITVWNFLQVGDRVIVITP